jgi:hypothetical protein
VKGTGWGEHDAAHLATSIEVGLAARRGSAVVSVARTGAGSAALAAKEREGLRVQVCWGLRCAEVKSKNRQLGTPLQTQVPLVSGPLIKHHEQRNSSMAAHITRRRSAGLTSSER